MIYVSILTYFRPTSPSISTENIRKVEAATGGVLWKKLFLKISHNSQETICVEVSFNKVAGLLACIFIKKRLQHRFFLVNIAKFLRTPILKNSCERLLLEKVWFSEFYKIFRFRKENWPEMGRHEIFLMHINYESSSMPSSE